MEKHGHDDNGIHGTQGKTNKRKRQETQETDEDAGSGGQHRDGDGTTKDGPRGNKRRSTMIVGNPVEHCDPARTHTSANQHTANPPITETDTAEDPSPPPSPATVAAAEDTPPVVFTTTFPEIERGLPGYIHSKAGELPPFPTPVLLPPWLTESDTPCTPPSLFTRLSLDTCPLSRHLSSALCCLFVLCPLLFVLCYLSLQV